MSKPLFAFGVASPLPAQRPSEVLSGKDEQRFFIGVGVRCRPACLGLPVCRVLYGSGARSSCWRETRLVSLELFGDFWVLVLDELLGFSVGFL